MRRFIKAVALGRRPICLPRRTAPGVPVDQAQTRYLFTGDSKMTPQRFVQLTPCTDVAYAEFTRLQAPEYADQLIRAGEATERMASSERKSVWPT